MVGIFGLIYVDVNKFNLCFILFFEYLSISVPHHQEVLQFSVDPPFLSLNVAFF